MVLILRIIIELGALVVLAYEFWEFIRKNSKK